MPIIADRSYTLISNDVLIDQNPFTQSVYDRGYFERFKKKYYSPIGMELHRWRRALVETFSPPKVGAGMILDFGCGYGELVVGDTTGRWRGYDIIPETKQRLGILHDDDPEIAAYDVVCLFDVFEHLPDPGIVLDEIKQGALLVVTLPCWEQWDNLEAIQYWRHFRPGEHLFYSSKAAFIKIIEHIGYKLLLTTTYEIVIGRQDVVTFIFLKMTPVLSQ